MKRHKVQLTREERDQLQKLISSGVAAARKLTRARILLKVDGGMTGTKISQVLDVTNNTVTDVCRTFQTQRLAPLNASFQIASTGIVWMAKQKHIW